MPRLLTFAATIALALALFATQNVDARVRRHRRVLMQSPSPTVEAAPPRFPMFYPEHVQGGVPGNLPFNNQVRKLSDPLNANGGR